MTTAGAVDTGQRERRGRLQWADVARGGCVLLVVTHHLVTKHYDLTLGDRLDWAQEIWLGLTMILKPLRMPLFFTLSGFFAARAVARPWGDVVVSRVAGPYYLYAVWLVIHAVIFSYATTLPMNRTRSLEELALDLVYASTSMWYLYALPVYFVLIKLLRGTGALLPAVAGGLVVLALVLPIDAVNRVSVLQNFAYFAMGASLPSLVRRMAESADRRTTIALLASYAVLGGSAFALGASTTLAVLVGSLAAVPLAYRAAAALSRRASAETTLAWVGRRTLPIYVLHVPAISLLHHLPNPLGWAASGSASPALAAVTALLYPLVATALVTGACLLTHAALSRCGFGWLFRRPAAPAPVAAPR